MLQAHLCFYIFRYEKLQGWPCQLLIGDLPNLEELYLAGFKAKDFESPDGSAMLGQTGSLRAAFFHFKDSSVRCC